MAWGLAAMNVKLCLKLQTYVSTPKLQFTSIQYTCTEFDMGSVVPYPILLFCTALEIMFCFLITTYSSPPATYLMASCKDAVARSMLPSSLVLMLGGTLTLLSPICCLLRACSVHHSTLNFWAVLSAQIVHFIFACFSV